MAQNAEKELRYLINSTKRYFVKILVVEERFNATRRAKLSLNAVS